MRGYIDIHTHILPGIDDGSSSQEETFQMMRLAYYENIRTIIATPHYGLFNPDIDMNHARKLVDDLNRRLQAQSIDMSVLLGCELYYVPGIVRELREGKAATMADTSYALVEFGENVTYQTVASAVQEFTRECYKPIIAHVERYECLRDGHMERIKRLRQMGAFIQVNIDNFTKKQGLFNRNKRIAFAQGLLQADLIDFIASDAHNESSRQPIMESAVKSIKKRISEEQFERIFYHNILAMISNEYIDR